MTSSDSSGGGSERSKDERALREEVTRLVSQDAMPAADLGRLRAALTQELAAERGPRAFLRARPTGLRVLIACSAVLGVAAVSGFAGLRPDHGIYPPGRMAAIVLFIAGAVAVELAISLRPLQLPALPRWLPTAAMAVALAGLFVLYALPAAHLSHPASLHASAPPMLLARAVQCLAIGLGFGVPVHALLRALDRGGADRALIAAVCAGLAANLGLQLHCPITAPAHMLLGHLGVALLLLAAAASYRRIGRPR